MIVTANQLYKEYKKSGGTLSFKDWMNDQKKEYKATGSGNIPMNKPLSDSINQTLDSLHRQAGYKDTLSEEYILGIPKNVVYMIGIVLTVSIAGYIIYQHKGTK